MAVFDTVYNPQETRFLREAKAAGCKTIDGVSMFVNQAADQFKMFTGLDAPKTNMRKVVEANL
jgi:shikimate 5-dehydrogenase